MNERDPLTPLRGRDTELGLLRAAIRRLADGQGQVVLVKGVPGVGKTRLLAEAVRSTGFPVRRAAGEPDRRSVPFAPLLDALPEAAGDDDRRYYVLSRLQEALGDQPMVVVVDDLQWCDPGTLLALRTIPAREAGRPVLWLLATRTEVADADVRAVLATLEDNGARTIELAPLDDTAALAMATDQLGAPLDEPLAELVRGAEGRPLLLHELLHGLREEAAVDIIDGVARLTGQHLPTRFRRSILRRIASVGDTTREVVQVASVLARHVAPEELADLIGLPVVALLPAIQEALAADLLTEDDSGLTFRHDLVREAIESEVPPSLRRTLRRQAVNRQLKRGMPVSQVAAMLAETALPGDLEAVALLRRATAELAASAPATAAQMSVRAVDLCPPHAPERALIVADAVPLLNRAGAPREAFLLADTALGADVPPDVEQQIRLGLAGAALQLSFTEAIRQAEKGLALPGALRAPLLAIQTFSLVLAGETESADALLPAARETVAADPAAKATLINVESIVRNYHGDFAEALRLADRAVRIPAPASTFWSPEIWQACLRDIVGRSQEALAQADDGVHRADRSGQPMLLRLWSMTRCRLLLGAGRLDEALAEAEAVLAMSDDLGPGNFAEVTAHYVLGRVAVHTGDPHLRERGTTYANRMRADEAPLVRRVGAWLAAQLGDVEATAEAEFDRPVSPLLSPIEPTDEPAYVALTLQAGFRDRAAKAVAHAERRAERNPDIGLLTAAAKHARGLFDADRALLLEAADRYQTRPLVRAAAWEQAGELERAEAAYAACGAENDVRRVQSSGVRPKTATSKRPATGWDSLTPTELAVVRLVAAGASNRAAAEKLYVSPHTVNTHVRHAFAKLGVTSRVELARIALRHDQT
ncbi:LuxR C-terminal-related transcriptional regulator [Actinoplanes sp. CA-131856]